MEIKTEDSEMFTHKIITIVLAKKELAELNKGEYISQWMDNNNKVNIIAGDD